MSSENDTVNAFFHIILTEIDQKSRSEIVINVPDGSSNLICQIIVGHFILYSHRIIYFTQISQIL